MVKTKSVKKSVVGRGKTDSLSSWRLLNPLRLFYFILYLFGPFFFYMAKANVDVAYRVITGKINPGIIKLKTGLKTDFGVMLLANSITLTPGTLTVEVDEETNDLYVHWINVKDKNPSAEQICGSMLTWVRRIAE